MPLSYKENFKVFDVHHELAQWSLWNADCVRLVIDGQALDAVRFPALAEAAGEVVTDYKVLERRFEALKVGGADAYQDFSSAFDTFISRLFIIQAKAIDDSMDYDYLTGLKNVKTLELDVKREQEKLSRQGQEFCLALIRIDDYQDVLEEAEQATLIEVNQLVSESVKDILRSFDDAYILPDNQFLVLARQTQLLGGVKALERICQEVEEKKLLVDGRAITVSACVSEPLPESSLEELVEHLNQDLTELRRDISDVVSLKEISPLERYSKNKV